MSGVSWIALAAADGAQAPPHIEKRGRPCLWFALLILAPVFGQSTDSDPKALLEEADKLVLLNNWIRARPLFAKAEKLFEDAGDARNALYCKVSRLRADVHRMPFTEVAGLLAEQLETPLVQNDPRLKLRLLVVKGNIDLEIDPPASRRDWEEVLAIAKSLKDRIWESRAEGELGVLTFLDGDSAKAQDTVGGALFKAFMFNDTAAQVRYLTLIGAAFSQLGRYSEALQYLEKALKIIGSAPDAPFPLLTHTARARALAGAGRLPEAREALNTALARARQGRILDYEAELLVALAELDLEASDQGAAVRHLKEGATFAAQSKVIRIEAAAAFHLAKLYRQSREFNEARKWAVRGLTAVRNVGETYSIPTHLAMLAAINADTGKVKEADGLYEEAADIIDGILVNATTQGYKSSFLGVMSDVYLGHFRLLAEHTRDVQRAFYVVERARGRVSADALRARSLRQSSGVRVPLAAEREIASLQLALMRTENSTRRRQLLDELFAAEQRLRAADSSRPFGGRSVPASLRTVRGALREDEVLLEYVLADPTSYCLVITSRAANLVRLASRKEIESGITRHLTEVKAKASAKESGRLLYRLLLAPIQELREKTRLVVVPDGAVHGLSLDSLVDEAGRYAVESHAISYAPSGTALQLLRTRSQRAETGPLGLVIGGVDYQHEKDLAAQTSDAKATPEAVRGIAELRRSALSRIPHTEDEVKAVAAIGGADWTTLMGAGATESRLKALPLERYSILHFATHGISDVDYPDRAALVLGWEPGATDEGLLQAREISGLNLNAELVVLSSCDTGEGRLNGQEGVASMARAFLAAGARSVVASQWAADDTSTLAVMSSFYQALQSVGDRAAALRHAKQEIVKRFGPNAAPYYWAGFVLVGESTGPVMFKK
jgi:CHAT domain-containing protein/tetratricopeptide (TPR) repeat protein